MNGRQWTPTPPRSASEYDEVQIFGESGISQPKSFEVDEIMEFYMKLTNLLPRKAQKDLLL
ncbi:hypothetical protein ACS0TY_023539 [Phlomoides rotata]